MDITIIQHSIEKIKNYYRQILNATETFNNDSRPEAGLALMEKRTVLLEKIQAHRQRLQCIDNNWQQYAKCNASIEKHCIEIQMIIKSIAALDAGLNSIVQRKLGQTKRELAALNKTSHAALSYARYTPPGSGG